ncbi:MAG: hypothetical protein ACNS61_05590 [Candidatus Wenzhouxiangella sp. M2_3B_020]
MDLTVWLALAGISLVLTGLAVYGNPDVTIVTGVFSAITWTLWAFGSTALTSYTETGEPITRAEPAVAYIGIGLAVLSLLLALLGTEGLLDVGGRIIKKGLGLEEVKG